MRLSISTISCQTRRQNSNILPCIGFCKEKLKANYGNSPKRAQNRICLIHERPGNCICDVFIIPALMFQLFDACSTIYTKLRRVKRCCYIKPPQKKTELPSLQHVSITTVYWLLISILSMVYLTLFQILFWTKTFSIWKTCARGFFWGGLFLFFVCLFVCFLVVVLVLFS